MDSFFFFFELVAVCYGILSEGCMYVASGWLFTGPSQKSTYVSVFYSKAGLNHVNVCPFFTLKEE